MQCDEEREVIEDVGDSAQTLHTWPQSLDAPCTVVSAERYRHYPDNQLFRSKLVCCTIYS